MARIGRAFPFGPHLANVFVPATAHGAANLTGAGTVTVAPVQQATAAATGQGGLSAGGTGQAAVPTLTGAGTLTAAGVRISAGAAVLTGAGTLGSVPARQIAVAALTAAGTLTAAGATPFTTGANVFGVGTLTAAVQQQVVTELDGTGTVTVGVKLLAGSALAGAGTLTAVGRSLVPVPGMTLTGTGSLAAPPVMLAVGANLAGAGTLTVLPLVTAVAALNGAGALTAAITQRPGAGLAGFGLLHVLGITADVDISVEPGPTLIRGRVLVANVTGNGKNAGLLISEGTKAGATTVTLTAGNIVIDRGR